MARDRGKYKRSRPIKRSIARKVDRAKDKGLIGGIKETEIHKFPRGEAHLHIRNRYCDCNPEDEPVGAFMTIFYHKAVTEEWEDAKKALKFTAPYEFVKEHKGKLKKRDEPSDNDPNR